MSELAIDDIHFDDFSLDVDAMITAALRMFMELGMVQKFKIDYEVRCCVLGDSGVHLGHHGSHSEPLVSQTQTGDDNIFPAHFIGSPKKKLHELFVKESESSKMTPSHVFW